LALAVPLSRFTPQFGGGSAFFVRRLAYSFMKIRLIIVYAILVLGLAGRAQAQGTVQSLEIVDHGIYKIELTGEHVLAPSAGAGAVQPASRAVLVATTNQIPPKIGITFGCHFIPHGEPDGAIVDLTILVRHPAFRKPDGSKTSPLDVVPWRYRIGEVAGYTYTFDHDWEAVPGKWSIEVWRGQEKLAAVDFVVTPKPE